MPTTVDSGNASRTKYPTTVAVLIVAIAAFVTMRVYGESNCESDKLGDFARHLNSLSPDSQLAARKHHLTTLQDAHAEQIVLPASHTVWDYAGLDHPEAGQYYIETNPEKFREPNSLFYRKSRSEKNWTRLVPPGNPIEVEIIRTVNDGFQGLVVCEMTMGPTAYRFDSGDGKFVKIFEGHGVIGSPDGMHVAYLHSHRLPLISNMIGPCHQVRIYSFVLNQEIPVVSFRNTDVESGYVARIQWSSDSNYLNVEARSKNNTAISTRYVVNDLVN